MSWAEAFRDIVIAACVMVVFIHLFADGFRLTINHKGERTGAGLDRQRKAGKEE